MKNETYYMNNDVLKCLLKYIDTLTRKNLYEKKHNKIQKEDGAELARIL
jgi:hypothetical protein